MTNQIALEKIVVSDKDVIAMAQAIADMKFDGHLTIMKFTSNWRMSFYTISDREEIQNMPKGKTLFEAFCNLLNDPCMDRFRIGRREFSDTVNNDTKKILPKPYAKPNYDKIFENSRALALADEQDCFRTYFETKYADKAYHKYLESDIWKSIREQVFKARGKKCSGCGKTKYLQVHHLTYENIYNEFDHLEDLIVLCRTCHKQQHDKTLDKEIEKQLAE